MGSVRRRAGRGKVMRPESSLFVRIASRLLCGAALCAVMVPITPATAQTSTSVLSGRVWQAEGGAMLSGAVVTIE